MGKHKWPIVILSSLVLMQIFYTSAISNVNGISTSNDWMMFRHDQGRSGYSDAAGLTNAVNSLWVFKTGKAVMSSPAVADDYLLVGSRDWRIYCLNSSNGRQLWNCSTGNEVNSSPAVYNGSVYVGSDDGYLYCIDLDTGMICWKSEVGGLVRSSPAVVDGKVYIGSGDHDLICLNASDGAKIQTYQTSSRVHSSPAVMDGVIYVVADDFHVYAFNASSGSEIWRRHTGSVFSSPCVRDERVYIGSADGYVCCLNASTGIEIWTYKTSSSVSSSPAAAYGYVYVGCDNNNVYCLNASNGEKIWESPTGYWVRSSPAVVDGCVYVGSEDFNIYCLDAFTGQKKWSYSTGSSVDASPATVNGILYIGSSDSNIYAFSVNGSTADSFPPQQVNPVLWTRIVFDGIAVAIAVVVALGILWFARTARPRKQQIRAETISNRRFLWASSHADVLCIFVILAFSAAFFVNLANGPLWATGEQTYSQWAFHMLKTGDYLTPWSFGQLDFGIGKPPLFPWLTSLAFQIFGVNNFAARFWSAMFGSLSLVLIFFLGKKLYNPYVGLFSTLVLGTLTTFYTLSTRALMDVTFVFFLLGSLYFLLLSDEGGGIKRYAALGGLFFGFAFMTKQVEALLIPFIILTYFIATRRGIRYFFTKRFSLFWQIGVLIVSPWIVYMLLWFGPTFWNFHFVFQDAALPVSFVQGQNYLYYFSYLIDKENLLWVTLLPFAAGLCVVNALFKRSKEDTLVFLWMAIVLVFFTFVQTKLFWYILPAFPAFALAIGSLSFKMLTKVPRVLRSPFSEMESGSPEGDLSSNVFRLQSIGYNLKEHFPIVGILIGFAFLSISLGPFSSWDSRLEFSGAMGVIHWGMPYTIYGSMINTQPLGLYIGAFFLRVFGVSYTNAVAVTTLFALGSVFLVYQIGETLYGKQVGLFAASLFALAPWLLIMSRVFLVDVYCLFFSLLYLLVGIWSVRKDSPKLFIVAGTIFGLALLAKLFAVFMLIPLVLFFVYSRPKNFKRASIEVFLFLLPAFLLMYVWYGLISGQGLFSMLGQDDFGNFLPAGFAASPFYSLSFLVEIVGTFFVIGCFLSLIVSSLNRKRFSKVFFFDITCFATVVGVVGFNAILVFYGNLIVPYVNSIKYNFLALPMLCLLAASAAKKAIMISQIDSNSPIRQKLTVYGAWISLYLVLISMVSSFLITTNLAEHEWVSFLVPGNLSYSFNRLSPILGSTHVWEAQVVGFVLILFSLLWAYRTRLLRLFSSL